MALHRILTVAKWSYGAYGEQPIRLPNGLLYPRVEVEQRTHSGNEIVPNGLLYQSNDLTLETRLENDASVNRDSYCYSKKFGPI